MNQCAAEQNDEISIKKADFTCWEARNDKHLLSAL